MPGVLYISYDGMLEPLGQSQVLSYLSVLSRSMPIHLISFEKAEYWHDSSKRDRVVRRMRQSGITWHPLRYHKTPSALATAWDILCGTTLSLWLACRHGLKIVHARSYVASVMALVLKLLLGRRFIFDMRGFWADERVDGGIWPAHGRLYRIAKWFERRFLLSADDVVSLTHAAVAEMHRFPYLQGRLPRFTVIPTCADLDLFKPNAKTTHDLVIGYVGSVGTWYLFDKVAASFCEVLKLRPTARILILNRNEHALIQSTLIGAGVPMESVELLAVDHADVAAHMRNMDAGIFFIKPVFSKQASAPTKLAEFLGCGVPCLANTGVGDMGQILEEERVGVAVDAFDPQALQRGVTRLLALLEEPDVRARCAAAARQHFSLEQGVDSYALIYGRLAAEGAP